MARSLNLNPKTLLWPKGKIAEELVVLKPGHTFNVPRQGDVMFAKISPEQIAAWEVRFGNTGA